MKYNFEEVKQLIVLSALILIAIIILTSTIFFNLEMSPTLESIFNMIVGALIGVLGTQAYSRKNKDSNIDSDIKDDLHNNLNILEEPVDDSMEKKI